MKHLKKYKLFEAIPPYSLRRFEELKRDMNDILIDIQDDGYKVEIDYYSTSSGSYITCEIFGGVVNQGLIDDITRIIEFMKSEGYSFGSDGNERWLDYGSDLMRIRRPMENHYYEITLKELTEFIGIEFLIINLVFIPY